MMDEVGVWRGAFSCWFFFFLITLRLLGAFLSFLWKVMGASIGMGGFLRC